MKTETNYHCPKRSDSIFFRKYVFIISLFVSLSAYCQDVQIKDSPMSVKSIFETVKEQTGFITIYSNNELDMGKKIPLKIQTYDIKSLYSIVLENENLNFNISGKYITISPKKQEKRTTHQMSDTVIVVMTTISGTVTDKKGEPLPGVRVNLSGTLMSGITDADGKYSFRMPENTSSGHKIRFKLLGMKEIDIPYERKPVIDAVLEEDALALSEVIVTGYQSVNRKDMVGAYTQIKAEEILLPSQSSIDEMLQGQVAGLIVTNITGRAGGTPSLSLRGQATILGNTQPLWVIDGIIQSSVSEFQAIGDLLTTAASNGGNENIKDVIGGQISWLNPHDIETITVLKDASATALYGSRASNGVIVITTKKGTEGRIVVNYTGNVSIRPRPTYNDYNVMNSQERINFSRLSNDLGLQPQGAGYIFKDINTYDGILMMYKDRELSQNEFIDRYHYLESINTDWLKLLTHTAINTNHNVSISGGTKTTKYNASLGYDNTQGIEVGNDKSRYSGRMRLNFDLASNLNLDLISSFSMSNTSTFSSGYNPLSYALSTSRAIPAYNEDGEYTYYKKGSYTYNTNTQVTGLNYSVLNDRDHTGSSMKEPRFDATINLSWKINPMFTYQFVGGLTSITRNMENFADAESSFVNRNYRGYDVGTITSEDPEYNAALLRFGGVLETNSLQQRTLNAQNKLLFEKVVNKDHRFNAMAAWEVKSMTVSSKYNTVYGYMRNYGQSIADPTSYDQFKPIGSSSPYPEHGVFKSNYKKILTSGSFTQNELSAFATVAYNYRSKYILNMNARNDISNRFGRDANKVLNPTFSFGAKWRLCEEDFMKGKASKWLDQFNLSVTYGVQGNVLNMVSPELILGNYRPDTDRGQMVANINRLPNEGLTWEQTRNWDFGSEISLFGGLLSADIHYYWRKSAAALETSQSAENGGVGYRTPMTGLYIVNTGADLTIRTTPINKKDMMLTLSFNTSKNWNSISKIIDNSKTISTVHYLGGQTDILFEPEYPIGSFWRFDFGGLDPQTGYPIINRLDPNAEGYSTKFTDFLVYAGSSIPSISGGLNLTFRYKSVVFTSSFATVMGNKKILPNPYDKVIYGNHSDRFILVNPEQNLKKDILNRWQNPGDESKTYIPVLDPNMLNQKLLDPGTTANGQYYNLMYLWERSNALVVDGSFLRCRLMSLKWSIPTNTVKKLGLKNCSLNVSVSNLFVFANKRWNGMDPELGNAVMPKTYTCGINLGF